MNEEWRAITGYEGLYEVSSLGRVRSMDRIDTNGKRWYSRLRKSHAGKYGHAQMSLSRGGTTEMVSVHHLVLTAFVGARPNGMECCHNDGDPTNNAIENLRWDTRKANNKDRIKHGTAPRGERNPAAKMPAGHVNRIRDLRRIGYTQQVVADWLGIGRRMVGQIAAGTNWSHTP